MDLTEAIFGRRATRHYSSADVAEATLEGLIHAAVHAPSALNGQPWAFTVVRDRALMGRLSRDAKAHLVATSPAATDSLHGPMADEHFHIFYDAPVLILISATAEGPWVVEDCALAAQNLMLAAYAAGLGSCWIGSAQTYLNTREGKMALDMPAAWVSVAPIIIGHPTVVTAPVSRNLPLIRWVD